MSTYVDDLIPDLEGAGFKVTGGKGFHVTLDNGWTVSVQFGHYNYCERYVNWKSGLVDVPIEAQDKVAEKGSPDAEVAIWDPEGEWVTQDEYQQIWPRITPDNLLKILNRVANMDAIERADDLRICLTPNNEIVDCPEVES